ncbi:MAG: MFS transporter [Ilumatobacteraceae bacterium]
MLKMLRSNTDLRRMFVAQVISYMGDWFSFVALVGLIKDLTDSNFLVSMVMVSFSLPSFFASPIAGPMVDRFDRRRILMIVSGVQAAAALGLLLVGADTVWLAFVFQSTVSALAAVIGPASQAAIPNVVRDPDELSRANALLGSTWGVMLAVGAAIGGLFAATFGRDAAFVANAVSFVLSGFFFARVRTPMQAPSDPAKRRSRLRPIADMREALAHARRDPVLMALMLSKTTFAVGSGVVSQLAVLASDVFKGGDGYRGILIGARGLGAGIGPALAMKYTGRDLGRVLMVCGVSSLAFSLCYLTGAWMPVFGLAAFFIVLAHLGGGAQWTLSTFGLQMRAPDEMRGRIIAGDFALVTLMMSVTSALAGLLSDAIGVRETITVFTGAAAVASFVYITATRHLRTRLLNPRSLAP